MTRAVTALVALIALSACEAALMPAGLPPGLTVQAADAASRSGLPEDIAARPSVELAKPRAFALTDEAKPFLQALDRTVAPMRERLAAQLLQDATVVRGLSRWEASTTNAKVQVLERIAALQGEAMGCQVPAIALQAGRADQAGTMAYFQPSDTDLGQIVLFPEAMASGGKYLLVATLIHEIRHAAQYQLIQGDGVLPAGSEADHRTLSEAYAAAWQAIDEVGGQTNLAYGDYVHLNMEYDAFQSGNYVAARLSEGAFNPVGYGFVDTHYRPDAQPILNLLALAERLSGYERIASVNEAEFKAERAYGGQVRRQRPQGFALPRRARRFR